MSEINLIKAQEEFIKYTQQFDLNVELIKIKQEHSIRVMQIANEIAEKEGFSEEEVKLATLIGLLHDIARFKQYTEYSTYKDRESFDHGDMAVKILEQNNFIRRFIETDIYDEIIKIAIKNHNKPFIENNLTNEQEKFSKLVRDADKIDIFSEVLEMFWINDKEKMEYSTINLELKKEFDKENVILYDQFQKIEYADKILQILAFIFDVNFKSSFEIIKKEEFANRLVNKFKFKSEHTQKTIIDAGEHINKFIMKKISK